MGSAAGSGGHRMSLSATRVSKLEVNGDIHS